jgi:hypothetical protein
MGDKPDPNSWSPDVILDTPAELAQLLELRRAA